MVNGDFMVRLKESQQYIGMIEACLTEKLKLIQDTKLLITGLLSRLKEIPSETLQVCNFDLRGVPTMMLEILKKRRQTLDLISMMQELQRTCIEKVSFEEPQISRKFRGNIKSVGQSIRTKVRIHENLSCLPRLQLDDETNVKKL